MLAAKALGANQGKGLKYLNSGDVTGDRSRVVGYAAGVFYKRAGGTEKMKEEKKVGVDLGLNEEEKKTPPSHCKDCHRKQGKRKARSGIQSGCADPQGEPGRLCDDQKKGQLRGCIGYIEGRGPLYKTIEEMAEAAGLSGSPFQPREGKRTSRIWKLKSLS